MKNNILWIRNDLRFEDNTALLKAVETCHAEKVSLTLIFHINTEQVKQNTYSDDYFFSALNVFLQKIKTLGGDLLFLYGSPERAFRDYLKTNKNIDKVFFNISECGYGAVRDNIVVDILKENNIKICSFYDKHLHSATSILNGQGCNYKVFTSYYKRWMLLPKRKFLRFDKAKFQAVCCSDFENSYKVEFDKILVNRKTNFEEFCGLEQAFAELELFIEQGLKNYQDKRDDVFADSNSNMSQYLATGQISIRQVYHAALESGLGDGAECFIKQLAWRDFYNMVYYYNPEQAEKEIIAKYRFINWNQDKYAFHIWKYGLTGFPIVDSAMRNLIKTGKMHNRLRMITASFLVKDLLIDWRMGEKYFKDMLIDYDSASNIGSWQWVASTGTDACPYFRVFNPTTQSKRFDANGYYIKSSIAEFVSVDRKYIHEPHKCKMVNLEYPEPIVEHKVSRIKVLEMYKSASAPNYTTDMKYEFIKRYTLYKLSQIKTGTKKDLIEFHSNNKYLYFKYSITLKDKLGQLLAEKKPYSELYLEYRKTLVKLFEETPDVKKAVNAYQHIYGYFKKQIDKSEKEQYQVIMEEYLQSDDNEFDLRRFFRKLADKYNVEYIKNQTLLSEF